MRRVTGSDGRQWLVRRRWLPWEPQWRGGIDFNVDGASGGWEFFGEAVQGPISFVLAVLAAIVAGILIALVTPLVFLAAELLLLVVLLPLFVVMRFFLGQPWVLVATTKGPPRERIFRSVQGWRASERALLELRQELRLGVGGAVGNDRGFSAGR